MNHRCKLLVIAILLFATAGCTSPGTPAATEIPLPSATPAATPTSEPTPTFTPTPDRTATQAAEATAAADEDIARFRSEMSEYGISTDSGHPGWVHEAPVMLVVSGYQDLEHHAVVPDLETSDFILRTDVTWESNNAIQCGIVFRAAPEFEEGERYGFWFLRQSGRKLWEIQFWDGNAYLASASNGVRYSSDINLDNGGTNQILLVAEEYTFTVYINGVRQGEFHDHNSLATTGRFGFAAYHYAGDSTCTFANTVIWVYR